MRVVARMHSQMLSHTFVTATLDAGSISETSGSLPATPTADHYALRPNPQETSTATQAASWPRQWDQERRRRLCRDERT